MHLSARQGRMSCTGWPSHCPLQPYCLWLLRLQILFQCRMLPQLVLSFIRTSIMTAVWQNWVLTRIFVLQLLLARVYKKLPIKEQECLQVLSWESAAASFWGISQYWFLGLKQNIFTRASAGVSRLNMAYTPCYCFIIMYNWQ